MAFTPRRLNFVESDLQEIEAEFLQSSADIHYDKTHSRLYPSQEEALQLHQNGFTLGAYEDNNGRRTIIGFSQGIAIDRLNDLCVRGNTTISPLLHTLRVGVHEAAHFFADIRNKAKIEDIVKQVMQQLPKEQADSKLLLGLDTPTNIRTYIGEAIADIAAGIYLSTKYPDDPAIQQYLQQLPGFRAQNGALIKDYYHNNAELYAAWLASKGTPNDTGTTDRSITIEQATQNAIAFLQQNVGLALSDVNKIINTNKLDTWGLPYNDLKTIGLMNDSDIQGIEERKAVNNKLRTKVCPSDAPTPPPN